LPNNQRIRSKALLPERMAKDHHGLRIRRTVILRQDGASEKSIYAEQREEIPRNELAQHDLTLARLVPDDGFRVAIKRQHPCEGLIVVTVIKIVGIGQRQIAFDA